MTFKKAFETAQSKELASKKDFRDTSVPVDDTVNKGGKYASPGHSNEEAVSCFRCGGLILFQGAGPGWFNVTSVTLRVTLLRCAIRKGR